MFNNFMIETLGSAMLKPSGEEAKEDFIEWKDDQVEPRAVPNIEYPTDNQGSPARQ